MNGIPPETMQGYLECFGADCLDLMRDLAAQGDREAQELLELLERREAEAA